MDHPWDWVLTWQESVNVTATEMVPHTEIWTTFISCTMCPTQTLVCALMNFQALKQKTTTQKETSIS